MKAGIIVNIQPKFVYDQAASKTNAGISGKYKNWPFWLHEWYYLIAKKQKIKVPENKQLYM